MVGKVRLVCNDVENETCVQWNGGEPSYPKRRGEQLRGSVRREASYQVCTVKVTKKLSYNHEISVVLTGGEAPGETSTPPPYTKVGASAESFTQISDEATKVVAVTARE